MYSSFLKDLSDLFSVRKDQLLGTQRSHRDLWLAEGTLKYLEVAIGSLKYHLMVSGRLKGLYLNGKRV